MRLNCFDVHPSVPSLVFLLIALERCLLPYQAGGDDDRGVGSDDDDDDEDDNGHDDDGD